MPRDTRSETIPAQGETQEPTPREPHERDESSSSQAGGDPANQRMGRVAHDDMAQGRVDTDKRPAMEEAYDKQRAGTPQPEKQFRP